MRIELHILQSFAPSNLNRDDTGAPKDADFGGFRRARISSQCLKRAMRTHFHDSAAFEGRVGAVRTKRAAAAIARELADHDGVDEAHGLKLAEAALGAGGLKVADGDDDERKTQYLLFVPKRMARSIAELLIKNKEIVDEALANAGEGDEGKKSGKAKKKELKDLLPKPVANELKAAIYATNDCPELALFGRMIADAPENNVEAACQVAHAISTNRIASDFDFYTAVDDLKPADNAGADMMGTVQFNASCFYRYQTLDLSQLTDNLGVVEGDAKAVARETVAAWLRAATLAVPAGKQNSMAAHNPPGFVMVVVRDGAPVSLANAFLSPARPSFDAELDLLSVSVAKLTSHLDSMVGMYGAADLRRVAWMAAAEVPNSAAEKLAAEPLAPLCTRTQPLDTLIGQVLEAAEL